MFLYEIQSFPDPFGACLEHPTAAITGVDNMLNITSIELH